MNLCSIEIISEGDGWESRITAEGRVKIAQAVEFSYPIDGDECTLSYINGVVTQRRVGGQNITITFKEGEETFCNLSSGGFSGSYGIFTRRLSFNSNGSGYLLSLEYLNGDEPVTLTFKAILH